MAGQGHIKPDAGKLISKMHSSEMTAVINAILAVVLVAQIHGSGALGPCRSFCGNVTVAYPFGIEQGCGHPKFRDLVYCINNVMMLHIVSGSYQVVSIDYGYRELTLYDPKMSTCRLIRKSDGFAVEPNRSQILKPTADNVFMLLGCSKTSPLFEGFPGKNLPCQNVTGIGCESFYSCPVWVDRGSRERSPPLCCGIPFASIGAINLTHLDCYSYTSAYASAPIKINDPREWSYGIQLSYVLPEDYDFCKSCQASRGVCGYDITKGNNLCLCDGWNSTSSCDEGSGNASAPGLRMAMDRVALLAVILLLCTI